MRHHGTESRSRFCCALAVAVTDPEAPVITKRKGEPEPDPDLRDNENVPLPEGGVRWEPDPSDRLASLEYRAAVDDYVAAEVQPYVPDAWVDHTKTRVGYEIPFTRHFYKYVPPRPLAEIDAEIKSLEGEIQTLRAGDTVNAPLVPLKRVARINPETLNEDVDPTYEFRYVDIATTGRGCLVDEPAPMRFGSAPSRARRVLRRGDTIISTVRTYLRASWSVGDDDEDLVASTGFAVLRPGPTIQPGYLKWLVQADLVIEKVTARSVGVSYPAINPADIGCLQVPVPDLSHQRGIADYLDRETARIDALVAAKRRLVDLLVERDFVLLSDLLVPSGCSFTRLRFLATIQSGLTVDAARGRSADDVTRPYLRVANVQAGWLDLEDLTSITVPRTLANRSSLKRGDVLMTEGGDLDKLGRGTMWEDAVPGCLHQNHIFAVKPSASCLDGDFLALLTRTAHARAYFEGTGVKTTNLASTNSSKILDLPVPTLGISQQQRLVAVYEERASAGSAVKSIVQNQIALLTEHRQALITAAVAGELDVPEVAA